MIERGMSPIEFVGSYVVNLTNRSIFMKIFFLLTFNVDMLSTSHENRRNSIKGLLGIFN